MYYSLTFMFTISQLACTQEPAAQAAEEVSTVDASLPIVRAVSLEHQVTNTTMSVAATLEAVQTAVLLPKSAGRIASVTVRVGQRVQKGDVLLTVESSDYAYGLQDAEGVYAVAAAQLSQAEVNLERFTQLVSDGSASQAQLDEIQTGADLAEAQLQRAEAGVGVAKARLRDTRLIAPFDGVVIARNVGVGELIGGPAQRPPLMLADTSKLRAVASVSEGTSVMLETGMTVELSVPALPELNATATIEHINAAVDPVTRTVLIEAQFDNPEGQLKHGMSALLQMKASSEPQLLIPRQALLERSNGTAQVYVLENGKVTKREVRYAPSTEPMVPVLNGLEDSERVVVAGHSRLKDGDSVKELKE